ncbi:MAG: hypothetical protein IAE87_15140 [Rhodobacteraceae bacterium]|nr:hypothetical protein [Paracoccaceae bacterium]
MPRLLSSLAAALDTFGAAARASAAVRVHRTPALADLQRLNIPVDAMRAIRL